jgi:uncharacterized protein with NRDE domain
VVIAANRDEFLARPTAPLAAWSDLPQVIAGRDLEKGGTWLGVSTRGTFAAVTNFRNPLQRHLSPRSRGALVTDFLAGDMPAASYVETAVLEGDRHDGFNLIAADRSGVWYGSNRGGGVRRLGPGIHGLSNHLLDTPWPKVRRSRAAVAAALDLPDHAIEAAILEALGDDTGSADAELPDTGVGLDWERRLAPAFIRGADYGTRCSSVLIADAAGSATFTERTFGIDGALAGTRRLAVSVSV